MTNHESRKAAEQRIQDLIAMATSQPPGEARDRFIEECEALARAVAAFHMEGIRFRAYNVDRLLHKGGVTLPDAAAEAFRQMRSHLEAAGFHTRSHQSPT
jgi:hypothetical protein